MKLLEKPVLDPWRNYMEARERCYSFENAPLFHADWTELVFHHFKVDAVELQKIVPFELDLYEGNAYVSLVGFHSSNMWLDKLGRWTGILNAPFATHDFLNVRTYVKHKGEAGIYFMTEIVNRAVSVPLGRLTFGLPFHFGKINYLHSMGAAIKGSVSAAKNGAGLVYESEGAVKEDLRICEPDSLNEFLCEKYTAYTSLNGKDRVFRIIHEPWMLAPIDVIWTDLSLLTESFPFIELEGYVGSAITPGVKNVFLSKPRRINS